MIYCIHLLLCFCSLFFEDFSCRRRKRGGRQRRFHLIRLVSNESPVIIVAVFMCEESSLFSFFFKRKIHRDNFLFIKQIAFNLLFPQIEQFSSVFLPSMASKKLVQNLKMKGWKGIDRKSRSVVNGESIFAICSKIENIFIGNFFLWRKGIENGICFLCLSPQVDGIYFPSFLPLITTSYF